MITQDFPGRFVSIMEWNPPEYELISDTESVFGDLHDFHKTSNDTEPTKGIKKSKNKFKCNECKFSSKEEEHLIKHKKKHEKEYSFKCTFCEKCFPTKTNSDRHIRTHKGERNYVCRRCQKSFSTKANCKRHIREKHTDIAVVEEEIKYEPSGTKCINTKGRDAIRNTDGFCSSAKVITCLPAHSDGNANYEELQAITNGNENRVSAINKVNEENTKDITSIAIDENNKKVHTHVLPGSKRKIQRSYSEYIFEAKKITKELDKDMEIITKTNQLEDRNSSSKKTSMKMSLDRKNFKIETSDNETNDNLPILTSPKKSLKKSRENNCRQRENNVLPELKKEIQSEHHNDLSSSSSLSLFSSVVPLKVENRENLNDVPGTNGFQINFKGWNEDETVLTNHNTTVEVVVDIDYKTKENPFSVTTQCEMLPDVEKQKIHINCDNIKTDKMSCSSQNCDVMDTTNEVGMYVEEYDLSNDYVTILPVKKSYDSYDLEIEQKKAEEHKSGSISKVNCSFKMLDDSSPIPFISKDQDTTKISCTHAVCKDNILRKERNVDKLRKAGMTKENTNPIGSKSEMSSLSNGAAGSLNKRRKERASNVFSNHKYFLEKVLNWKPVWFDEYEIFKKTPPDISEGVNHLLSAYDSYQDYFNILFPHLLLETWESCLQTWQSLKGNRPKQKCVYCRQEDTKFGIFKYAYFTVKDNVFNKGDLLILNTTIDDGKCKASLCYIEKISYKPSTRNLTNDQVSALRSCDVELKLQLKSRHFDICPAERIKDSTIEFVHSLNEMIVLYNGLSSMIETKLFPHVLEPGDINVFANISTKRHHKEFDMLMNKDDFNHKQRSAILNTADMVTKTNSSNRICIIQGPFGTGKTETIIGIIKGICQRSGGKCCIGLCAPTHVAVENLMKKLISERTKMEVNKTGTGIRLVLIGDDNKYHLDVQKYSHKICLQKEIKRHKRKTAASSVSNEIKRLNTKISSIKEMSPNTELDAKCAIDMEKILKKRDDLIIQTRDEEETLKHNVLLRANVICGTCSSFGDQFYLNALSSVKNKCRESLFTCLIMDEAQQATELETLVPLQYGTNKLILAGDPEQLQPTVKSQISRDKSFDQSIFQRFCDHFRYENCNPILVLDTQYRSHPEIAKFPSNVFYGGQLNTHRYSKERCEKFNLKPYIVFNIDKSTHNITTVDITISLYEFLYSFVHQHTKLTHMDFGIITSLSHINKIKEGLANRNLSNVEVDTVTGFQGRTKEVIILACSGDDIEKKEFLTSQNELNVALTRARSALFIVGNFDTLSKENESLQKLVADARERRVLRIVKDDDSVSNTMFSACLSARARLGQQNMSLL
ncbi:SETX [Mytilus coruscus]|uniref:SETX n=1 Tax=Mytilus coruscus TaxID=42192 RepID=A0A6J8DXP3_MYTCO|nr:SETX [Mytilus coruscus]